MGLFNFFGKKGGVQVNMSPVPGRPMVNPAHIEAKRAEASEAKAASAETAKHIEQSEFPGLYEGMVLSVINADNVILFHGKLSAFTPDGMTLKRPQGVKAFPLVEVSKPVKVRGYDRDLEPISISCIVRWSSETQLTLASLTPLAEDEHRACFRVPVYRWGIIEYQNCRRTCTVINISTGGAGLLASKSMNIGEHIVLLVKLLDEGPVLVLPGEVVRTASYTGGKTEHGIKFDELAEDERNKLVDLIFRVQAQGVADGQN